MVTKVIARRRKDTAAVAVRSQIVGEAEAGTARRAENVARVAVVSADDRGVKNAGDLARAVGIVLDVSVDAKALLWGRK